MQSLLKFIVDQPFSVPELDSGKDRLAGFRYGLKAPVRQVSIEKLVDGHASKAIKSQSC